MWAYMLVSFLAFFVFVHKSFFSFKVSGSERWLLISTKERTTGGQKKRNASNLVNWVKCFEYWVLCYHKIGIYWDIGNYVECLALSATQKMVSYHRTIVPHGYLSTAEHFLWYVYIVIGDSMKKTYFRAIDIISKSYLNLTYQHLYACPICMAFPWIKTIVIRMERWILSNEQETD